MEKSDQNLASTTSDVPRERPTRAIRFVPGPERTRIVDLAYPIEVDGVPVVSIVIRRLTAGEVAAFVERMQAEPDRRLRWPMTDQPDEVLDALDADDAHAVNRAISDFLPRYFQGEAGSE